MSIFEEIKTSLEQAIAGEGTVLLTTELSRIDSKKLKSSLLSLGFVLDNQYLDKYVELVNSNIFTKKLAFKTQQHHIVPRYYYKYNKLILDNSKENLINLCYKDHVLAHYYLALCSSKDEYRYANELALNIIFRQEKYKKSSSYIDEKTMIENLEHYQQLYEESKILVGNKHRGKTISPEVREKERIAHLGKKYKPMSSDGKENISKAHIGKNTGSRSDQTKQAISIGRIGLKYIHKENEIKAVPKSELQFYLNDGWILGNPNATTQKGKICITNGIEMKFVLSEDLDYYINLGWRRGRVPHSDDTRQKISIANQSGQCGMKGRKHSKATKQKMGKYKFIVDNQVFYTYEELINYISNAYTYRIGRVGIDSIISGHKRACSMYPQLLGKIIKEENIYGKRGKSL